MDASEIEINLDISKFSAQKSIKDTGYLEVYMYAEDIEELNPLFLIPPGTYFEFINFDLAEYNIVQDENGNIKHNEYNRRPILNYTEEADAFEGFEAYEGRSEEGISVSFLLGSDSSLRVERCRELKASGIGTFEFFNTANIRKYDVSGQNISFTSKDIDNEETMLKGMIENKDGSDIFTFGGVV